MSFAVIKLLVTIIDLYWYLVIGMAIMSWLIAFDVINMRSNAAYSLWRTLNNLVEPVLNPIRSVLPNFGGVDISPIVLILVLYFVRDLVLYDLVPALQ